MRALFLVGLVLLSSAARADQLNPLGSSSLANLTYLAIPLGTLQHDYDTYAPIAGYIAQGSSGSPITTNGDTFSITRYQNMPVGACASNPADTECVAALNIIVRGGATDTMVQAGLNVTAIGGSSSALANPQAISAHSIVTGGPSIGEAIYIEGQRTSGTPAIIGAEITAWNNVAAACGYGAAIAGNCIGALIDARGNPSFPDGDAILIGPAGNEWQNGVDCTTAGITLNCIIDNGSGSLNTIFANGAHTNIINAKNATISTDLIVGPNTELSGAGVAVFGSSVQTTFANFGTNQVQIVGASDSPGLLLARFNNDTNPIPVVFYKSQGTSLFANGAVASGQVIGQISGFGDDGTNPILAATLQIAVDGAVSTGVVPGEFVVRTKNTSGVLNPAFAVRANGDIDVGTSAATKVIDSSGFLYSTCLTANAGLTASCNLAGQGKITTGSSSGIVAGGDTSHAYCLTNTAGFCVYAGSGAPTISAAQGSLYVRSDGSSAATRLYVNTTGSTTWTNFVSAL